MRFPLANKYYGIVLAVPLHGNEFLLCIAPVRPVYSPSHLVSFFLLSLLLQSLFETPSVGISRFLCFVGKLATFVLERGLT